MSLNCSSKENFFDDQRPKNDDSKNEPFCPFTLPDDEFGEMMFAKRFKPEGSSSPLLLPNHPSAGSGAGARRQSAVEDTDGKPGSNSRVDAWADRKKRLVHRQRHYVGGDLPVGREGPGGPTCRRYQFQELRREEAKPWEKMLSKLIWTSMVKSTIVSKRIVRPGSRLLVTPLKHLPTQRKEGADADDRAKSKLIP